MAVTYLAVLFFEYFFQKEISGEFNIRIIQIKSRKGLIQPE
jgi:hypothetical protein